MEKPILSPVQRAWLREIGIDAKMLAHFSASPYPADEEVAEAPAALHRPDPNVSITDIPETGFRRLADLAPQPVAAVPRVGGQPSGGREEPAPAGHGESTARPQDIATLAGLREQMEQCRSCGLHLVRGRPVFGEGAESAPGWMFIGEAPGEYDDSTGRPFQGRAGELLQAMLASVGLGDDAPVYFTNVIKCRPMGNRSPAAEEVAACMPLLRRQIMLLRPACLVALGRVAATALLGRDEDLDSLRGSVHAFVDDGGRSIPLVVTHHPASLLLHGRLKADAWRDMNLIRHLALG